MEENLKKLKYLFSKIKENGLNESLRNGYTGIGYTFESLLGKAEDRKCLPDFNGIEIKTKIGYSKNPLTLFSLVPFKNGLSCIKYINETFGYTNKYTGGKKFKVHVYHNHIDVIANKYIFKLKLDKENNKLRLIICDTSFRIIDNQIYWNLDELEKRLSTKLNYLAVIKGYPYEKNNKTFYKYTNMTIYKLKSFDIFLNLIEQDKIFVLFNIESNIKKDGTSETKDRGTVFKLKIDNINELFNIIE